LSLQGVGLDRIGGHASGPPKSHESRVHDGGRACGLPRNRGCCIPRSGGGISRGMHDILQAGILCSSTPISPLFAIVLWLTIASLNPLEDLTHGGLCDPMRDLYGD
jgi:hypothetical protein